MLDKVIRFFIVLTFVIAGGALLRLATPWMATLITTEFFQVLHSDWRSSGRNRRLAGITVFYSLAQNFHVLRRKAAQQNAD